MVTGRSGAREQTARIAWRFYTGIDQRLAPVFEEFLPEEAGDTLSASGEHVT